MEKQAKRLLIFSILSVFSLLFVSCEMKVLPSPEGLTADFFEVFWEPVENADEYVVSIDGEEYKNDMNRVFKDGRGSYSSIIDNVFLWLKQFPNAGTNMVISHNDLPYVKQSLIHLVKLGITKIDVNPVIEDVWKEDDDKILENELIDFADYIIDNNLWQFLEISVFNEAIGLPLIYDNSRSFCGDMTFAVDGKGNLYPCMRFADYSLRSKKSRVIGNLLTGIDCNKLRSFQLQNDMSFYPLKCRECNVASGCKVCPAENYDSSLTNTVFQHSLVACDIHKAKVRAKNYYWNKLRNKCK